MHAAYLHLSKDYYVTDALKFGGDFLAYEGDPLLFHAKYLVKVSDEPFDMVDVVQGVRSAASGKKPLLLL